MSRSFSAPSQSLQLPVKKLLKTSSLQAYPAHSSILELVQFWNEGPD